MLLYLKTDNPKRTGSKEMIKKNINLLIKNNSI